MTWQGALTRQQFSTWMAPSQALCFPRPSTEALNGLQPTSASAWGRRGPRVCCEWSSDKGWALPDIASGCKTPLPSLAQGQELRGDWGLSCCRPCSHSLSTRQEEESPRGAEGGPELRGRRLPGQRWQQGSPWCKNSEPTHGL